MGGIMKWDEQVKRMDAERLVKNLRDNVPAGWSPGFPKRRWRDTPLLKQAWVAYSRKEKKIYIYIYI